MYLQISIDNGDSYKERLLNHRELHMNFVQPVHQNSTHFGRHLLLVAQPVFTNRKFVLQVVHVFVNVVHVLRDEDEIVCVVGVDVVNLEKRILIQFLLL